MSFVKRSDDAVFEEKNMFGAPGMARHRKILNGPEEMLGKGRLYNHVILDPGCGIGWHVHNGDGETFFVLKGEAEYSDNGAPTTLRAGDIASVLPGEGHSVMNNGTEPFEMIALILYA